MPGPLKAQDFRAGLSWIGPGYMVSIISDTGARLGTGWIPVLFLFLLWGRESKAGEDAFIWLTILSQSSLS